MITNRINYSSESDDTNAGRAEMFFLFFNRTSAAGGERRQYGKVLKLGGPAGDRKRTKGAHDFHRAWRETGKGQDYHHKGDQELFHRTGHRLWKLPA